MKLYTMPDGTRLEVENAMDRHRQIYTHEFLGSWNVSRIQEEFARYPNKFLLLPITVDERLIKWIFDTKDIDKSRIEELMQDALHNNAEQMKAPVVGLETTERPPDAPMQGTGIDLIDGHHKLIVASALGVSRWPAIVVPLKRKERYRVKYFLTKPGEERRQLSNTEILSSIWGIYQSEGGFRE